MRANSLHDVMINGRMSGIIDMPDPGEMVLGDPAIQDALTTLIGNASLKSLNLGSIDIGDDGAGTIANSLNRSLLLKELHLSDCKISVIGLQKIVRSTSTHATLKVLNVRKNLVGYPCLTTICTDLASSKLSSFEITVHSERFADPDSPEARVQRQAQNTTAQALVAAVKANYCLRELDLGNVDIPERAKNEIKFFLDSEKLGGQLLCLDDGLKPFGLWSYVLSKCGCSNVSVLFYLLGEQPMLVPTFSSMVQPK